MATAAMDISAKGGRDANARGGAVNGRVVGGWKEIAAELERLLGLGVSVDTAIRYSRNEQDPLPVEILLLPGAKAGRVLAKADALERWVRRQVRARQ